MSWCQSRTAGVVTPRRATFLVCLSFVIVLVCAAWNPAKADAAYTISPLGVSADPTEDELVTLTATGSSEAARTLYMIRSTNSTCGARVTDEEGWGLTPTGGGAVGPGSYSKTMTFTPAEARTVTICSYISESNSSTPLASRRDEVVVRLPNASVDPLGVSADPTEDELVTLTATGSSEAARTLYMIRSTNSTCGARVTDEEGWGLTPTGGGAVGPGSYSKTMTFTPAEARTVTICSYISESNSSTPLASRRDEVVVRLPNASLNLGDDHPEYLNGDRLTQTISGSSEHASDLYYRWGSNESDCPTQRSNYGGKLATVTGDFSAAAGATGVVDSKMTLCAALFQADGYTALTVAKKVFSKRILEAPANLSTEVTNRVPTFRWKSPLAGSDSVVLNLDGAPQLRVTTAGTVLAEHFTDDSEQPVDENGDPLEGTLTGNPDPDLGKLVVGADGSSSVRLTEPLLPGRYTWRVERSRDAGETAESEQALTVNGPPLKGLVVKTTRRLGATPGSPGYTLMSITTTQFVRLKLTLRRAGRDQTRWIHWGESASGSERIDWSCKRTKSPNYRFVLEARDYLGKTITRTGSFSTVTKKRCGTLEAAQKRRIAHRRAYEIRRQRAQARREAAQKQARARRFVHNCYAAGGTPRNVQRSWGNQVWCRGPYGGFIWVPW